MLNQFIDWAFYGKVPKNLETDTLYKAYKIWCDLFNIKEPMTRVKFLETWINL